MLPERWEKVVTSDGRASSDKDCAPSGGTTMEAEKRIRREIANSNERRRMQSINAGFQALRTLLPRHEGEKLSKAAILQQTAEYIYSLEQEKTRLLSQNCQLKRLLNQHEGGEIPLKKRKNDILSHHASSIIPDSTEDAILNSRSPEPVAVINVSNGCMKKENSEAVELRGQLDRERRLRLLLEEQVRALEAQTYGDRLVQHSHPHAQHVTLHYETTEGDAPAAVSVAVPVSLPVPGPVPVPVPVPVPMQVQDCEVKVETGPPCADATPLLEAAIKAEPRVEVEVLPEHEAPSRLYLASTSRQNLETIVEAIRHLEGDHLFGEEGGPPDAEAPLALTKKLVEPAPTIRAPMGRSPRPGVIVVKHS
ncbi:Transcription factor AP-4 [Eumeta japonica]|uniref:Transcription factor AP-4 n=1 Tax=Eumeta variegata TaxID=151549 RepID=A0A4C1XG08_EUMVA|nr:Transcription factor AP-4 [Eumeta japonica]